MNCTLTIEQQKLFIKKIAADLDDLDKLDFDLYAKEIYDLVVGKTNDKILAANYVALLPTNIWAVLSGHRPLRKKFGTLAGLFADLETKFEDFKNVEDFVSKFITDVADIVKLEKTIQKESLVSPPQQQTVEATEIPDLIEGPSLSDIPMDNDKANFLKPEMKPYADVKEQLIRNKQPNGTTKLDDGTPVRLTLMSTVDFKIGDHYPDVQAKYKVGEKVVVENVNKGVVLVVTDMKGNPHPVDGRLIHYYIRDYKTGQALKPQDIELAKQITKTQNVTQAEAEKIVLKKLNLLKDLREYINKKPSENKVFVNLTGGTINYAAIPAKQKPNISAINFKGGRFNPYKGIPNRGQKPNVYYFDMPGSNLTLPVDSAQSIPIPMVDKLVQLLMDDLFVQGGSNKYKYGAEQKIKLFKQFVFLDVAAFDLTTNDLGNLVIKKLGVTQQYPTKEDMSRDIRDQLTRKVPTKPLTVQQASGKTKAVNLQSALYNQVWEQVLPDGKVQYYEISQVQLKINDTAFKSKHYDDFEILGDVIKIQYDKPYYPFVADNFVVGYQLDADGNFQNSGSVLNFEVTPESFVTVIDEQPEESVQEKENVPVSNVELSPEEELLQVRNVNLDKFNKLIGQKGLEATVEQIDQAKIWYDNNPLSSYFPFKTMFDLVNKEDSNSIANWTLSGITLYKGADYSDLYHEAWHGFTQGLMSKDDKIALYSEMRRKSGGFVDYNGNTIKFKEATDLQIEEFLAEDFREYMLSDGEKVMKDAPKRNSFFRKIWNFLKKLFGNSNVKQTVIDEQVSGVVSELYQKLRIGDISGYTFAEENRNFDNLNKALQSINKEEPEPSLSFENSILVFNTVESLFSEGVDILNQANIKDIEERRQLQSRSDLTPEEKTRLGNLNLQTTSSYTTLMLSTTEGLKRLYKYAKGRLEKKLAIYKTQSPSVSTQKRIDLLEYALRNFGDINSIYQNKKEEGVIGYHLFKSGLVQPEVFDELKDQEELEGRELEGKNFYDRGGNEMSVFDLVTKEVKNILTSLSKTDLNGNVINNQLGFPELLPFKQSFAYIARVLQNSKDVTEMYGRLQKESNTYPPIKQLLNKLGPLYYEGISDREVDLWSKFYQAMNKYRIPLIQTTVNEQQEEGKKPVFDLRIGNALSDDKRVDQDWRSDFAKLTNNPFIRNDVSGNYLDTTELLKKWGTIEKIDKTPIGFLNDIGINIKEIGVIKDELDKALNSGSIRLSGIYGNLQKLNEKGVIVRGLGKFLNEDKTLGIIGQTGPNSNYGKILTIQTKYSGDYSDFMVQNAAGDPQSEFTQNNTLTQLTKQINTATSYNELVSNVSTAHYNNAKNVPGRPYNPFVNASIWMKSLFDMEAFEGPKYDNEIVIENLSGINRSINDGFFEEGVALSQADEVGKLLNDFHVQLMKFTPELTRHAGKKTSLTAYLKHYKTGAKNNRLYIDTEDFLAQPGEFNAGIDGFNKIINKYITAELDRVNYAKYLQTEGANVQEFDFEYLKRATKFVAFSGVLSESTKSELYAVEGDWTQNSELSAKVYDEVSAYFLNLVKGVETKMKEIGFVSPSLVERTRAAGIKAGKPSTQLTNPNILNALSASFVANNWIHHFEEMIMFYGDIALYKDFFKRNASLNSTGDIVRTDADFLQYANESLGRKFTEQLGANALPFNEVLNSAVVADVLVSSVYLDKYKKALDSPVIEEKYGTNTKGQKGVNEADAQGLISFDAYRFVLKGLGKWTLSQEEIYQHILAGKPLDELDNVVNFFPTLKMGYMGPIQNDYLPLTGLHKFALFPLIPGVIPQNLQKLHEKMMTEGIDYLTFESGSKVGTITKKSGLQPLYSVINKRELSKEPFVKNRVFTNYLKYQVESAPYFKNKVTLMTQLRKLAELGLTEKGVSTDYSGDKLSWNSLTEEKKREASKNYVLRENYINSLKELTEANKNKILKDIGWKRDKKGNLVGEVSKLLELISNELKRSGVGDHEWAYIQTIKGQDIKNSLDISQSADMIEKVVTALVNKRLINVKVNGEQLVMVSTTGWEDLGFAYQTERNFEKPSEEDLAKYGTNDLPTYHIGENGLIQAAKVKIAIQGKFKNLLNLPEVAEKATQLGITKLKALNLLLKDNDWLNEGDNRRFVTMVGARIPTQGPNSSDFVEVYEFLPEVAGNILIAPSEVTSKTGGDFDYDKLPLLMPNIEYRRGKVELARKYNKEEAQEIYDALIKHNIHKLTFAGLDKAEVRMLLKTSDRFVRIEDELAKLWGPSYFDELVEIVKEDNNLPNFEKFFDDINGTDQIIQNNIIKSLREMLEQPSNFADLIRPNDTNIVKPLADELRDKSGKEKEGTRMFEPLHNIAVQQANSVGKDTLGIGAISNTFNAVFNSIGLTLPQEYQMGYLNSAVARVDILLPHNKTDGEISLSNTMAVDKENIAEVISQLINGWVDVEKDDWISYIHGNKEVAPVLLFLVQAGVPIKDVVKFVTHPIIKEYVEQQRLQKSSFAAVIGKGKDPAYKRAARNTIMRSFGFDKISIADIATLADIYTEGITDFSNISQGVGGFSGVSQAVEEKVMGTFADLKAVEEGVKKGVSLPYFESGVKALLLKSESEKEAKFIHRKLSILTHPDKGGDVKYSQALNDLYDNYKAGKLYGEGTIESKQPKKDKAINYNLAYFLHYLELEQIAQRLGDFQRAFNVDTTPQQSMSEYYMKIQEIKNLSEDTGGLIRQEFIDRVMKDSPIGAFYVQDFALDLFGKVMPLRNSTVVNEFIHTAYEDYKDTLDSLFGDMVGYSRTFKNDLFSYIFQNEVRKFDQTFKAPEPTEEDGLKDVEFVNEEERNHYFHELERLKKQYPFSAVNANIDFNLLVEENHRKDDLRKEGETDDNFLQRIEQISYQEWLRNKALYNILSPWMLFKGKENVAGKYAYILSKYPHLKANFSVLNNIKKTTKDGYTNLMLSSMKLTKDEIDTFYENFQDLANSNKLLKIEGIDQRDGDYISEFFGNMPIWMYLQSGPNTKNPFGFGRVMPNDKILRILEKPGKELTANIDAKYLSEFLPSFIVANTEESTRQRFKEFLKPDETEQKPTEMQTELFEAEQKKEASPVSIAGINEITNHSGGAEGADIAWDKIGNEFGVNNHIHYWMNKKTPYGNREISEADKKEGQKKVTEAARQMGRIEPSHQVRDERLIRNWSQVKYSDAVFAITTLLNEGVEMNYGKKAKIVQGKGGTGYAVQMAINEGKPVYLFDQVRNKWYANIEGKWSSSDVPILTANFAGVGTREINDAGKQAIRDVYEKTLGSLGKPSDQNFQEEYAQKQIISEEELSEQIFYCK